MLPFPQTAGPWGAMDGLRRCPGAHVGGAARLQGSSVINFLRTRQGFLQRSTPSCAWGASSEWSSPAPAPGSSGPQLSPPARGGP